MDFFILLYCWILANIVSFFTNNNLRPKMIDFFKTILFFGIFLPIIEESFFRCTLYSLTNNLNYYKELNAILFGLVHLTNYFYFKNWKLVLFQSINNTFVGYYLISLNNIKLAILIHILYNISIFIVQIIFSIIYRTKILKNNNDINFNDKNFNDKNFYIKHNKFRRSLSNNDLTLNKFIFNKENDVTEYKIIKSIDIPSKYLYSFNIYDNIKSKKKMI